MAPGRHIRSRTPLRPRVTRFVLCVVALGLALGSRAEAAQLTLSWVDNSAGTAYSRIERKAGTGGTYAELAVQPPGVTSYTDTAVAEGMTYCYRVQAYNTAGTSPYSNEDCSTITATTFTLTVAPAGTGIGVVSSSPIGIVCGTDCTETYPSGTTVTLTATPAWGSTFTGWSGGGCSGTGPCTVSGNAPMTVTATFATAQAFALTVSRSGNGTVTSSPAGISCGSDCSENYANGTAVTLTASPAAGNVFQGWSGGGCGGTGACTVSVTSAQTVTATFAVATVSGGVTSFTLINADTDTPISGFDPMPAGATLNLATLPTRNLSIRANTSGTIGSVRFGYDGNANFRCESTAPYALASDTAGDYNAWTPTVGSHTVSGTVHDATLCGGTAGTPLSLSFTVTDAPQTFALTVSLTGSGTVTSSPAGISCGTDCTESYASGTAVTLTAAPAADTIFTGWSGGGCSGTGTCTVSVTSAQTVSATFAAAPSSTTSTLTVTRSGPGSVSGLGIACGSDCTETYTNGTVVTLTAIPGKNAVFTGWSGGGCSGTGTCVVALSQSTSIKATFKGGR